MTQQENFMQAVAYFKACNPQIQLDHGDCLDFACAVAIFYAQECTTNHELSLSPLMIDGVFRRSHDIESGDLCSLGVVHVQAFLGNQPVGVDGTQYDSWAPNSLEGIAKGLEEESRRQASHDDIQENLYFKASSALDINPLFGVNDITSSLKSWLQTEVYEPSIEGLRFEDATKGFSKRPFFEVDKAVVYAKEMSLAFNIQGEYRRREACQKKRVGLSV